MRTTVFSTPVLTPILRLLSRIILKLIGWVVGFGSVAAIYVARLVAPKIRARRDAAATERASTRDIQTIQDHL